MHAALFNSYRLIQHNVAETHTKTNFDLAWYSHLSNLVLGVLDSNSCMHVLIKVEIAMPALMPF